MFYRLSLSANLCISFDLVIGGAGLLLSVTIGQLRIACLGLLGLLLLVDAARSGELMGRVFRVSIHAGTTANPALNLAQAVRQVRDVRVAALVTELVERPLELEEVVAVQATRALAPLDVLRKGLRVLGPAELVVVGRTDVHERPNGRRAVGRVEGRVVNRVAVDLADVQVPRHLGHVSRLDPVGRAPDLVRRAVVGVREGGPEGTLDQRHYASRGCGCPAVVLAGKFGAVLAS